MRPTTAASPRWARPIVDGGRNVYLLKGDATGDTCCNWQPVPAPQTSITTPHTPTYLRPTDNPFMRYVYVKPPVPGLDPTELCFEPACVKAPSGVALWLPFDETSGTNAFNVLSLFGAPDGKHLGGPTPGGGRVGQALSFDAVDDRVVVANHGLIDIATGDFTIDAWIRTPAFTSTRPIVDKRANVGGQTFGYSLYVRFNSSAGTYHVGVQLADGTSTNYESPPVPYVPGTWHFVAARVDRDGTSHLVFDGASYPFAPGHQGPLTNTSSLQVGRNCPGQLDFRFSGEIDEVEVFRRALSVDELRDLWRAGSEGKCKEDCFLPRELSFCFNQNVVTAKGWICNATASPQTYTYWFQGLAGGAGCTIPGPTTFTPASPQTLLVPAGKCLPLTVSIARPPSMTALNLVGCYEMLVESTSGEVFTCHGAVRDRRDICVTGTGWDDKITMLAHRTPQALGPVRVTNSTAAPITLSYRFRVVDHDGETDAEVLSLDGLPPGTAPTGTVLLPAGGYADLAIGAEFVEYGGLDRFTLVLEADTDGDGEQDFLGGRVLACYAGAGSPPVYSGVAAPTTVGTPSIATSRNPAVGDAGFQVEAEGLVPNGTAVFLMSFALAPQPLPLALLGGQPGSYAYPDLTTVNSKVVTADASGRAIRRMPIPDNPGLAGAVLHWQVFAVDVALPYALPLGNSNAMSVTIQ